MTTERPAQTDWIARLYELLRRARIPVAQVVACDGGVDVRLVDSHAVEVIVEVRPRREGERALLVSERHLIRYRTTARLSDKAHRLLEFTAREIVKSEHLIPRVIKGGLSAGRSDARPQSELTRRFPFAFVEQSTSGRDVDTEVLLRVTSACNQHCPFCSAPEVATASPEALTSCLDFVCLHFPGARVTLTGGEPTLRPRFVEEVGEILARREIRSLQVQTNAVWFASDRHADRLAPDSRLGFFVSLHATDEALYDHCTGTTGQFPLALQGIRNLLRRDHPVVINTVGHRSNVEHLSDLVRSLPVLFDGLPRPSLHFSVLMCPEWRPDAADLVVPYARLAPALEDAIAIAASLGIACEPLVSSTHASLPLCLVSEADREASTHRPELAEGETRYDDLTGRWVKPSSCRTCAVTKHCLGLPTPYARRFGFEELRSLVPGPGRP